MNLSRNVDPEKYGYNGYGIGLDACSQFSFPDGIWGDCYLWCWQSSSIHADNKKKNILVLDEGSTQGFDNATVTANILLILENQEKYFS